MSLDIEVRPSFRSLGHTFRSIKLGRALQRGIRRLSLSVESEAKKETPVDTGRLRGSIRTDIRPLQAIVEPHTAYAHWIHEGWMVRGGKKIFIKGLGRAGTPPGGKPYMKLGMESALARKDPVFEEVSEYLEVKFR